MKGKYITKQILLACLSKPRLIKTDIHTLLEETIAERKRIIKNRSQGGKRLLSSNATSLNHILQSCEERYAYSIY